MFTATVKTRAKLDATGDPRPLTPWEDPGELACEGCGDRKGSPVDAPGLPPMLLCEACQADMGKADRLAARFGDTPEEYEARKAAVLASLSEPWDGL